MKKVSSFSFLALGVSVLTAPLARATDLTDPLSISNLVISQSRETRSVTVTYDLYNQNETAFIQLDILTNDVSIGMENIKSLTGAVNYVTPGTGKSITWNAKADWPEHLESEVRAGIHAYYTNDMAEVPGIYMVVDLSGGPNAASYPISYTLTPPDPTDETCRSNQLWLKRVETNTFVMGSPTNEGGHIANETLHNVTLTNAFFIGVFPVTRAQYTLVMGSVPVSQSGSSALCPVNQISYNDLRGAKTNTVDNIDWPKTRYNVSSNSFFGMLRSKTGGSLCFDLPTEAEWECACRAGTATVWNDGSNFETNSAGGDEHLDKLGWYSGNATNMAHAVGQKMPNAWGLYDCHGNV